MEHKEKKPHIVRQILFWTGLPILLFIAVFCYNEAPFMYWESNSYKESDLTKLMDERAKPVIIRNGNKKAVLFIHGFGSAPAVFEYYARLAQEDKFDVFVPLLPGMGTKPSDMLGQTFSGWYHYIQDFYLKYRKSYKEFYIVGVSMGGALTLKLAEHFTPDKTPGLAPTGIAVISAPVFINNLMEMGVVPQPAAYFARVLGIFCPEIPLPDNLFWMNNDGTERWLGYKAILPMQVQSLKMGLKTVKDDLYKITIPVYMIHASGDPIVHEKNLEYIESHIGSSNKLAVLLHPQAAEKSRHFLTLLSETRDTVYHGIFDFFNSIKK